MGAPTWSPCGRNVWPADTPPQSNGILPGTICTIRKHLVIHNIIYEHVLIDRQKYEAGD